MLKKLLYHLLERRHFWRYVGFDQLSGLYTSMMLRSVGLNLVGIFIPIYLYLNGYSLTVVMFFMTGVFVIRMVADFISGYLIAHYGPKRMILASNIIQLISLALLLSLPTYNWPLWWIALATASSLSLFYVSYHVNFSKIIHSNHGGKEIGLMTVFERCGAILGPLIGGVIATVYGADKTIIVAIVLFALASIPLMLSPEPTKLNQKITYRGLDMRRFWRDYIAHFGMGYDNTISTGLWPLYVGAVVFVTSTYAGVGLVTSAGILAAIISARIIGGLVDRHKGRLLLRWSVLLKSLINMIRPLVISPVAVALVNVLHEATSTGARLPFTKGMYDRADDLPGFRISYIVSMEMIGDLGKVFSWLIPALLSLYINPITALAISFVIGGLSSALIAIERFPALNRRRFL